MKRYGVTGGTGTIGFQLIKWLFAHDRCDGIAVLVEEGEVAFLHEALTQIRGDILDVDAVETLCEGSDLLFHLAARNPYRADITPEEHLEFLCVNALGTAVVSKLAERHGKRLILTSSIAVYTLNPQPGRELTENAVLVKSQDTERWIKRAYDVFDQWADDLIDGKMTAAEVGLPQFIEDHPVPADDNIYAISKVLAETFVRNMTDFVVLRLSDVYGPGDETPKMTPVLIRRAHRGEEMMWFDGRDGICPVYLGDVLAALLRATTLQTAADNRIINITGDLTGPEELMRTIRDCVGSNSAVSDSHRNADFEAALQFSHERARRHLGVDFTALDVGMRQSVEYYALPKALRDRYVVVSSLEAELVQEA